MIPLPIIVPMESSKVSGEDDVNLSDQSKCSVVSSTQVILMAAPEKGYITFHDCILRKTTKYFFAKCTYQCHLED